MKIAQQLSERDRLGAHMRDELGVDPESLARPIQAAWISAASFASFAVVPIAALLAAPVSSRILAIAAVSLMSLAALGAFGDISVARRSVVRRCGSRSEGVWRWR